MSKKRIFQVLDEMNVNDEKNKAATCACCFDLVEAKTAKGGAHVIMGVPAEAMHKLMVNEYKPMLVLLDMKEYYRVEALPVEDKLQDAERRNKEALSLLDPILDWGQKELQFEKYGGCSITGEVLRRAKEYDGLKERAERYEKALREIIAIIDSDRLPNDIHYIKRIATHSITPKPNTDDKK